MVQEDINLVRYLQMVRKRKLLVVIVLLFAVVVTLISTRVLPQSYKTVAVIQLSNPEAVLREKEIGEVDKGLIPKRTASYLVETATGDEILKAVIAQAKLKLSIAELRTKIDASSPEAGDSITLIITDSQPKRVALIANLLAENIVRLARRLDKSKKEFFEENLSNIDEKLVKIEEQRRIAEETISQAKADETLSSSERILAQAQALQAVSALSSFQKDFLEQRRDIQAKLLEMGESRVVKSADVPSRPSGRSLSLNLALALVLGLAAGVGIAIFVESWVV